MSPGCWVAGCCRVGLPVCRGVAGSVPGCRVLPGAGVLPGAAGCCRVAGLPGAAGLPGCRVVLSGLLPGCVLAAGLLTMRLI